MASQFLITDAGLAALVNAQQNGTLPPDANNRPVW